MPTGISGLYKNTKGAKESRKTHDVKILPEYFDAVEGGTKTFEIRFNDRDYKVGDLLCLREYHGGAYTGRSITREICYIIDDPEYCKEGYVVLGLRQCVTDTNVGCKSEGEQIEKMAKILASNCGKCTECDHFHKEINGIDSCYFKYANMLYNAGYRKQSEWISVDESLPSRGEWVICYSPTKKRSPIFIGCKGDYDDVWFEDNGFYMCMNPITHWTPLPEPPKKGGAG